ncbi:MULTISPECIES: stage III sporulation protein AA [Paenibacillus]|uniref:stage III sporulation protein AA n=1 Tax=Paenibacillus TaxID=44249 RepID=UPI0022B91B14|nr:stage III sporulation protein AA [Paenibacillus caseinilyticus]MCZ8520652.1 stage III sporulation protein AA [Paenibacillus caseinilyticus]
MIQSLLPYFSAPLQSILAALPAHMQSDLQEIRIRENRPLELVRGSGSRFVTAEGRTAEDVTKAYRPTREDCRTLLELLTQHSLYTFEEELKRGYITIAGGHRVGLAGRTIVEQGCVKYVKDVASFNIRLAREWKGAGAGVAAHLLEPGTGRLCRTLVVSPPQLGKTTLVRDLARLLSTGSPEAGLAGRSFKVGIVDERSEIAACVRGVPRFDVGPRTDVLDGCPKAEGMMMMIRSMSPEVLIADEIGRSEDAAAIHEALHAGIGLIVTAHGRDVDDVRQRPILRELLQEGVFDRFVVLSRAAGEGSRSGAPRSAVYNAAGQRIDERLALRGGLA